ncbi:50S ribosomal protein L20 [bioreactor metagenome]|uniref:50S ribosomal protein L20 n=1 Tax=bioreactor metagenome TaxID=1076179 RepID=A0A644YU70_9ZZZZ
MRIKGGMVSRRKHNKILKLARGFKGAKSKQFRVANQAVMKAGYYARRDRRNRKRDFRKLWIARINAASRMNGLSYSRFIAGLKKANVEVNRKMLADLAISDMNGFVQFVEVAKAQLNQ